MSEFSLKTIQQQEPRPAPSIQLVYVAGSSSINSDTLTVNALTVVKGAFLVSSTGVVGTCTFSTNVITVTNSGALAWTGLAWGT